MKHIFKCKSKLRIQIDTACDLSGYVDVTICAKKPDDTLVSFPAVVKNVEEGLIFYDVQSENDLDQSGWWCFWPEVIFDDDRTARGMSVKVFVYER